jgi:hypothetical protein
MLPCLHFPRRHGSLIRARTPSAFLSAGTALRVAQRRAFLQISLRSQPASKPAQDEAESLESVWIIGVGRHACNLRYDDAKICHRERAKVF